MSSEDHYSWDLVEVVEIPYANKCHESSTQQQSHVQTYPVIIISDLSQSSPLEDNDGVSLSYESTEGTSFQASCNTSAVNQCMHVGLSGGAMVLGKLPVPGRPIIWIIVGQGPIALSVGAGGGCLDIFTLLYRSIVSPLFLSLFGRRPDID